MASEIVNDPTLTPGRLLATLRAFDLASGPMQEEDIVALCQPADKNPGMAGNNLKAAVDLGLIRKEGKDYTLTEGVEALDSDKLRGLISEGLLARPVTLGEDNSLLPVFTAWVICNSQDFPQWDDVNRFVKFSRFSRDNGGPEMNAVKYRNYCLWASFLGLGVFLDSDFVPCPVLRIRDQLEAVFDGGASLEIKTFLERLASRCPELDGGETFNYVAGRERLSSVSPAVSKALRVLEDTGGIRLIRVADAEHYSLSVGEVRSISHIELGNA